MPTLPATLQRDEGNHYAVDCGALTVAAPPSQAGKLEAYVGKDVTFWLRPADIFDKSLRNPVDAFARRWMCLSRWGIL